MKLLFLIITVAAIIAVPQLLLIPIILGLIVALFTFSTERQVP